MVYNVIVRDDVYAEVLEAHLYYESKSEGLGNRFLNSLKVSFDKLAVHPGYYSILSSNNKHVYMDVKVKDFPYVVIFTINEKNVVVYAVHNTHKRLSSRYKRKNL